MMYARKEIHKKRPFFYKQLIAIFVVIAITQNSYQQNGVQTWW